MTATTRWVLAAIALLGCDHGCQEETPDEVTRAPAVSDFFPHQAGDRWRMISDPGGVTRNVGVTGVEGSVAVFHGTAHTYAERMTLQSNAIHLVNPEGATLSVLLNGPLQTDTTWSYALKERDVEVPCQGRITTVDRSFELGDEKVEGCVGATRECGYPPGTPFPRATKHQIEDVWCPGIGLTQRTQRFDPAPPIKALPSQRTERLVGFAVAGTPWRPIGGFDCSRFIVLPSDLRAACGASVQILEPFAGETIDGTCGYRYENREAEIVVEASHQALGPAPAGFQPAASFKTGETSVRVLYEPDACPPEQLARLEPLLRSLVREDRIRTPD